VRNGATSRIICRSWSIVLFCFLRRLQPEFYSMEHAEYGAVLVVRLGAQGMSLMELRQVAVELGLACQAIRIGVEQLDQVTLPAIAQYCNGHYVAFPRQRPCVSVGDPATGIVTWSVTDFGQNCSGCLLVFSPAGSKGDLLPSGHARCI
jgi:ABC-type bacteriocin/lantibiotic exporter with double-glycine peptidase domain